MIQLTPEEEKVIVSDIKYICATIIEYGDSAVMEAMMATVIDTVCYVEGIDKKDFLLTMLKTPGLESDLDDIEY